MKRRALPIALGLLVALLCLASSAQALWTTAGTDGRQWFVRADEASGGAPRYVVAERNPSTHGAIVDRVPLGKRPAQVAAFGQRLAVLFVDGTWAIASEDGVVSPPPRDGAGRILAIAGGRGAVWLIVGNADESRTLFRWNGRDYADLGPVPGPADRRGEVRMLVDRAMTIVASRGESGVELTIRHNEDDWQLSGPVAGEAFWLLHDEQSGPSLVTREGDAWTARKIGRDGTLGAPASLRLDGVAVGQDPALTMINGEYRLAWHDGKAIVDQTLDAGGRPVGGERRSEPTAMIDARTPTAFDRAMSFFGMAAMVLLLVVASRAKPTPDTAGQARTGRPAVEPEAAPLGRRVVAGLIDAWPVYASWIALAAMHGSADAATIRIDTLAEAAVVLGGAVAYAVISFACELKWGRTIGKGIFGLRVAGIDGNRPTTRALMLRNALRLLDLNLVTLILVPLTRLRQRLGDLIAGTVVVDASSDLPANRPAAPNPPEAPDPPDVGPTDRP